MSSRFFAIIISTLISLALIHSAWAGDSRSYGAGTGGTSTNKPSTTTNTTKKDTASKDKKKQDNGPKVIPREKVQDRVPVQPRT